jgi:UDP-glucose 4-epimerase
LENSKVLVTGGAGFIGSHVADLLIESGYAVVVVDDLSAGRRENVNKRAKFYETDMRSQDLAEVFDAERPDFVVHLAAQVSVIHSIAEPMLDASLNVLGSLNVLENSVRTGV